MEKNKKGEWSDLRPLKSINNPKSWESQPSVSADGNELIFASDRKGGFGGIDLYLVQKDEFGYWGVPQNMGQIINSESNEKSPFFHVDGKTMYFSSQGHNSLGGYDIFVSHVDDLGHWGEPINLGYPINTPYDDLFYSATASGRYAYISSNRAGGIGGLDIYKVTYWGADKPMSTDVQYQLIASIAKPVSDNPIAKPILVDEKSLTVFKGKVLDAITKKPIKATIKIILNETGKVYTAGADGYVRVWSYQQLNDAEPGEDSVEAFVEPVREFLLTRGETRKLTTPSGRIGTPKVSDT